MFTTVPNNPRELHRYLITHFLVSGIAISVLVGTIVYYWESRRVEMMAFEQALVSAQHFDSPSDAIGTFVSLAPALYGEIGLSDKTYLQAALKVVIREYF